MVLLIAILCYLLAHFIGYACWGRTRPVLRSEKGIFLFHAVSWLALVGGVMIASALLTPHHLLPGALLAAALHGIYSLSFLELWSLTQGSYSLAILAEAAGAGPALPALSPAELAAIGRQKRADREASLASLGLLDRTGGLTPRGHLVAGFLAAIITLSRGRSLNR